MPDEITLGPRTQGSVQRFSRFVRGLFRDVPTASLRHLPSLPRVAHLGVLACIWHLAVYYVTSSYRARDIRVTHSSLFFEAHGARERFLVAL